MIGIYLGAFKANHPNYHIVYQDINGERDLPGDMMSYIKSNVINEFDFIIATPPCNWWSRANYRRNQSEYALRTKHLLIDCIYYLREYSNKPFIIENVRNDKFFNAYGLFDTDLYVYKIGRHTYWTNVPFDCSDIVQVAKTDFVNGKKRYLSSQNLPRSQRQGGDEVHEVIECWLAHINDDLVNK